MEAAALDTSGNVIVVGGLNNGQSDFDFTVIKLSGTSGMELWRVVLDSGLGRPDLAFAVEVDAAGDVLAAGRFHQFSPDPASPFFVMKLSGTDGAEVWRANISGSAEFPVDLARTLLVDAAGDVIAGGYLNNAETDRDFAVVKLSGASGLELWRQQISGVVRTIEQVNAIVT